MDVNQRKKGVILTYATLGINILIGLCYTPFMIDNLGQSEYGIYSLATSLISFIAMLDLGFGQTIVRYIAKYRATGDKELEGKINGVFLILYLIIAVVALIAGIALLFIYPYVCKQTFSHEEINKFRIVFFILLINIVISFPLCIFSGVLNAYERFVYLKLVNLLSVIVKYFSIAVLLIFGYKVIALTIATVVASIGMQICYMYYCKKSINVKFRFEKLDSNLLREIFLFSFYIFINILVDVLFSNTDKLILGAVKGTMAVTIYSMGIYFTTYFQQLSTAVSGVFLPKIVHLYEKEKNMKKISDIFVRVGRIQMIILMMVLSGFVIIGKEFLFLWLGDGYSESYYIGLCIMLPSVVPLSQNVGITILRAMNLHKYRSYMYLAIAILNVGISIPLAYKWGGIGSAMGTCIATICGQIIFMNWFYAKKVNLDVKGYWKNFVTFLLYTILLSGFSIFIKSNLKMYSWGDLLCFATGYVVVYIIIYILLLANNYEKSLIREMLGKIFPIMNRKNN